MNFFDLYWGKIRIVRSSSFDFEFYFWFSKHTRETKSEIHHWLPIDFNQFYLRDVWSAEICIERWNCFLFSQANCFVGLQGVRKVIEIAQTIFVEIRERSGRDQLRTRFWWLGWTGSGAQANSRKAIYRRFFFLFKSPVVWQWLTVIHSKIKWM